MTLCRFRRFFLCMTSMSGTCPNRTFPHYYVPSCPPSENKTCQKTDLLNAFRVFFFFYRPHHPRRIMPYTNARPTVSPTYQKLHPTWPKSDSGITACVRTPRNVTRGVGPNRADASTLFPSLRYKPRYHISRAFAIRGPIVKRGSHTHVGVQSTFFSG